MVHALRFNQATQRIITLVHPAAGSIGFINHITKIIIASLGSQLARRSASISAAVELVTTPVPAAFSGLAAKRIIFVAGITIKTNPPVSG